MSEKLEFEKIVKFINACMKLYGAWLTESDKNDYYLLFQFFETIFFTSLFVLIRQSTILYLFKIDLNLIIEILNVSELEFIITPMYILWYKRPGKSYL